MTVPVLVPYRSDNGHRDRLWKWLRTYYWEALPYRIVEGESPDGPFNRAAAVNAAAQSAGDWTVAIIADADTWVTRQQLTAAISLARSSGRLVSALTCVVELSQETTDNLLGGGMIDPRVFTFDVIRTDQTVTESSMLAVPRTLWDSVGGMDEAFTGWGGEDGAFWIACRILGGEPLRIDGPAWHMWHQPATDRNTRMGDGQYRRNLNRWRRYTQAKTERQLRSIQAI